MCLFSAVLCVFESWISRLKITHDASGCRWWAHLPEVPAQHLRLHPLPRLLTTETPAQHLQQWRARARAARICRAQWRERHQRQGETDRQTEGVTASGGTTHRCSKLLSRNSCNLLHNSETLQGVFGFLTVSSIIRTDAVCDDAVIS